MTSKLACLFRTIFNFFYVGSCNVYFYYYTSLYYIRYL